MTSDLSQDLEQLIRRYLDGHRSRSLATLSRASGVAYSTLRRFSQREGHPTAEPVLKILDATLGTQEKIEFLERHFPEIARTISKYGHGAKSREPTREELKIFYRRRPHNQILNLAINVGGTSVSVVSRLFGERGLEALDELVECRILDRCPSTGKVTYEEATLVTLDCDLLLDQIRHAADDFDRSLIGTKAARLGHATAALSHAGLERVHEIVSRAMREISEVNEDPRYHGDIPYFVGVLMNLYDKAPYLGPPYHGPKET